MSMAAKFNVAILISNDNNKEEMYISGTIYSC